MSLTLRLVKGSALTASENDNNLTFLQTLAQTGVDINLTDVLTNGNTTGGNDLIIDVADTLDVNGTIDLTGSTIIALPTDGLSDVLAEENRTGPNDILIDDGQVIQATDGGGLLSLRNAGSGIVLLRGGNSITLDSSRIVFGGVPVFPKYTVATVPLASDYPGGQIMVTDEVGGYVPAFSDGTNWRRVTDRAIVS